MCDLFILIFLILFLKDYGLAINIFACSIQINTFNSLLKKKKKIPRSHKTQYPINQDAQKSYSINNNSSSK